LYALATDPEVGLRLRTRGATPSPESVIATAWDHVLAQFMVEDASTGELAGLAVLASPDFRNRFAYFSVAASPQYMESGLLIDAGVLLIEYAFRTWDFRKLYAEVSGFNLPQFRSALGRYLEEEGRLLKHEFFNGEYWDVHLLALYRDRWFDEARRLLKWVRGDGNADGTSPRLGEIE